MFFLSQTALECWSEKKPSIQWEKKRSWKIDFLHFLPRNEKKLKNRFPSFFAEKWKEVEKSIPIIFCSLIAFRYMKIRNLFFLAKSLLISRKIGKSKIAQFFTRSSLSYKLLSRSQRRPHGEVWTFSINRSKSPFSFTER